MRYESVIRPPTSGGLKVGRVRLNPGEEVGVHITDGREEMIVVVSGEATIIHGDNTHKKTVGHTHFVPEGVAHNVLNVADDVLEYIYIVSMLR